MKKEEYTVWRNPRGNGLLHDGESVTPPEGWEFVPSGDAGLTRRLKMAGECWVMVHRRRNRIEAVGLWTSARRAAAVRAELELERRDPARQRRLEADKRRREAKQAAYTVEFRNAVAAYLHFAERWSGLEAKLAAAVTEHAVPVGSGTVARTQRIPLERRAEAAVIAWMRHRTTAYDHMRIARVKGERREVRRQLAERSRRLLERYRSGEEADLRNCPLAQALRESGEA